MDAVTFADTLDQVCAMGFDHIYLTPMLGEVFADPDVVNKWEQLETEPRIRSFGFYTNFILARPEHIDRMASLTKLTDLYISLYGYDAESFEQTTRKPKRQFDKLLENLRHLDRITDAWWPAEGIHFSVRTVRTDDHPLKQGTELNEALNSLQRKGAIIFEDVEYDTWGGTISQDDVDGMGIQLVDGNHLYMRGTCTRIFAEVQIKSDGIVHACACRDVDGSLVIGDLKEQPLAEILSYDNALYRKLIEDQMRGVFTANCRSCSLYRSVLDGRGAALDPGREMLTFKQAKTLLSE